MSPADLRAWRLERHLSQAQMGRLLRRSRQSIANWEQGRQRPDAAMLELIDRMSRRDVERAAARSQPTPAPVVASPATDVAKMVEKRAGGSFTNGLHRRMFVSLVMEPPMNSHGVRRTGSVLNFPFWRAYDGQPQQVVSGTPAAVGDAAGKFRRELERRGLLQPA